MRTRVLRRLAGAALLACAAHAHAAAPTPEQVAQICASAEGPAHCARLIEDTQMKALPNLAKREGDTLTVSLFPSGQRAFVDVVAANTEKSYALFDYWSAANAVVLLVNEDDRTSFAILQRANGQVTEVPAEPVLAPDRQRAAVADFCGACKGELTVWRISRDGIRQELAWRPASAWADGTVRWKDADTLVLDYTPAGGGAPATIERKLAATDWKRP